MELFGKFFIGAVFWILLVLYGAWGYSYSWNLIVPKLFDLPTITMLQAWVAVFVFSVLTCHTTKNHDDDIKLSPFVQSIVFGYTKVTITVLFALLVKGFFL